MRPLVLRNRDVFLVWAGQVLSQVGTRMYQIALAWWIVAGGGGGLELAAFMVAQSLPQLLLVKLIGRTVDSRSSRAVLIAADLGNTAVVALVCLALAASSLTLPWLCAASLLVAAFQGFFDPALSKAVSEAAPPEDIEEAVAFQSSTQYLASFAGAALGALLIDRLGLVALVALNAASYLASAAFNAALRLRFSKRPAQAAPMAGAADSKDSLAWTELEHGPWLQRVLYGFGAANFFLTPILVILPLYVKETLRGGPSMLGMLETALWLGLVAGTFGARWVAASGDTVRLGAGVLSLVGLSVGLPGLFADRFLFFALLFVAGVALGINNVKFMALFQRSVPAEMKGRFFAVMQAMLSASFPVAFFLFGLLADWMSPQRVCLVQGLGLFAVAGYFLTLSAKESAASMGRDVTPSEPPRPEGPGEPFRARAGATQAASEPLPEGR